MSEKVLNTRKRGGKKQCLEECWLGSEGGRKVIITDPMLGPTKGNMKSPG